MAKRKADELEDFTGKHGDEHTQCTKEQVAEGSALLKKMLLEWKAKVSGGDMTPVQMKEALKMLAQGPYKDAFEKDPFFQSVKTLA
jgi:DNA mismatch repair protein MSH2